MKVPTRLLGMCALERWDAFCPEGLMCHLLDIEAAVLFCHTIPYVCFFFSDGFYQGRRT